MCRWPWRATAVRDIKKDVEEVMRESTYEAVVERSWLWWAVDKLGTVISGAGALDGKGYSGPMADKARHE